MADTFFEEQTEQSLVKAEIISKYFWAWAKVIIGTQKRYPDRSDGRVAYIDLFAGLGRYRSGAKTTPVMVVEQAIQEPDLCERLVCVFNDKDGDNTSSLQTALAELPGIEKMKFRPHVETGEVGEQVVRRFEAMSLVPTFFFVDPFGYKGLSLRLVNSVLKDWGCDCVFFFNYNRINMGLGNAAVEEHMDALFGKDRADSLRAKFKLQVKPAEREAFILEELTKAMKEMGGQFVLPFRFRNDELSRTTHHLIFVTKHFRGYDIMKGIMAGYGSISDQGVTRLEYNPADARTPLLFNFYRPLDDLADMLLSDYQGRTVGINELYEAHSVGKSYIAKNYREVLCHMEAAGKIRMEPPCPPRRKGTVAEHVRITFPRKESG